MIAAFVSPGALLAALIPELVLAAGALALLLATVAGRDDAPGAITRTQRVTRLALGVLAATAVAVIVCWQRGLGATADGRLAGDGLRWFADLVLLAGSAGALALFDAEEGRLRRHAPETPVLVLLALCGMFLMTAARDLMYTFLGLELMSIVGYVLAGVNRRSARSAEAALKYFLLGAFASGFLLYGIALLYGAAADTRLVAIAQAATAPGALFLAGTALVLTGFAFKVAAVPFHLWTPDVYDGAPLPVAAYMASAVKTAAFVAFLRVLLEGLGGAVAHWHAPLWWLAAITMVVGNLVALPQRNVRRLLAYSSIAHAGYLLVALAVASQAGAEALLFYLAAYTLATLGAFAVLGVVQGGREAPVTLDDLAGLWHVRPALATTLAVCLLAFLGFPLAGGAGFFAKWYLLEAALDRTAPQQVLAVTIVLASLVSAGYYLGVVAAMFARRRPASLATPPAAGRLPAAVMAVAVALLLVFGVYPTPMAELARRAVGGTASPLTARAVAGVEGATSRPSVATASPAGAPAPSSSRPAPVPPPPAPAQP